LGFTNQLSFDQEVMKHHARRLYKFFVVGQPSVKTVVCVVRFESFLLAIAAGIIQQQHPSTEVDEESEKQLWVVGMALTSTTISRSTRARFPFSRGGYLVNQLHWINMEAGEALVNAFHLL